VSNPNKVMLIIMDGWGLSPSELGNAPLLAKTPTLDYIYSTYDKTSLQAAGLEVGLNPGEPGNSEVGHMSIGSGRLVWENMARIDQNIANGDFFKNELLKKVFDNAAGDGRTLHLIGLVSDGGVHSHIRHMISIIEAASHQKVKKILVHFISDGRDVGPKSAESFVAQAETALDYFKIGRIATMIGRYFAMDRDTNWDREKKAFDLFVNNVGQKFVSTEEAIKANYKKGKTDEFFEPAVIGEGGIIKEHDSVIFFNHRSDRMRQLLSLFEGKNSPSTLLRAGARPPQNLVMATMTIYDKNQSTSALFAQSEMKNTLTDCLSEHDLSQFHTAETEKFAHVTYFFRGGEEEAAEGEKDKLVPSKKVSSYDKVPMMSAEEVTTVLSGALKSNYNFIVVNYANGDMVGHSGVLNATIHACEEVDHCLARLLPVASDNGYKVFITADHGNCEHMINDKTKEPDKEHTANPVPFLYLDLIAKPFLPVKTEFSKKDYLIFCSATPIGVLADVAPTIIANLGLKKPSEMDGMDLTMAMG